VEEFEDHFRFTVADNGMGIEPAYHNQIFEPTPESDWPFAIG
jgi:signal transduction histidine kinase